MYLKKKGLFSDLLQFALIVSALRFNPSLRDEPLLYEPGVIPLGPLTAYTHTRPHFGYHHPKNIDYDLDERLSILNELTSLGRYSRIPPFSTDIFAYLVERDGTSNEQSSIAMAGSSQGFGREGSTRPESSASQAGDESSQSFAEDEEDSTSLPEKKEETLASVDDDPSFLSPENDALPSSDLTQEDLELIEILWRQDIDLGVSRPLAFGGRSTKDVDESPPLQTKAPLPNPTTLESSSSKFSDPIVEEVITIDHETGETIFPTTSRTRSTDSLDATVLDDLAEELGLEPGQDLSELSGFDSDLLEEITADLEDSQSSTKGTTGMYYTPPSMGDQWSQEPSSSTSILVGAGTAISGTPKMPPSNGTYDFFAPPLLNNVSMYTPDVPHPSYSNLSDSLNPALGANLTSLEANFAAPLSDGGDLEGFPDLEYPDRVSLASLMSGFDGKTTHSPRSNDSAICSMESSPQNQEIGDSLSENSSQYDDSPEFKNFSPSAPHYPMQYFSGQPHLEKMDHFGVSPPNYPPLPPCTLSPPSISGYNHSGLATNDSSEPSTYLPGYFHNHTYALPFNGDMLKVPSFKDKLKVPKSSKENKDAHKLQEAKIPMTVDEVVNLPMEEYNERVANLALSESQINILKDIRRRGKNKVAAQNCRKRKIDQISELSESLQKLMDKEEKVKRERMSLVETQRVMEEVAAKLHNFIVSRLGHSSSFPPSSFFPSTQELNTSPCEQSGRTLKRKTLKKL